VFSWLRAGCLMLLIALVGCDAEQPQAVKPPDLPRGYSQTLQIMRDGQLYRFGPFVGYYFKPQTVDDFSRVDFICFNERSFYTTDQPRNAKLYEGEGRLTELQPIASAIPERGGRIRPVFFENAPDAWLESRPRPQDQFVHFHSMYDAGGAVLLGYWLKHRAVAAFTYDMGGRVGPDSPLHHRVEKGADTRFARIIEFDFGPDE